MGISFKEIWNQGKVLGEGDLILVTVGLMYGFERLVKAMDGIAGRMDEVVIMQIGGTTYEGCGVSCRSRFDTHCDRTW